MTHLQFLRKIMKVSTTFVKILIGRRKKAKFWNGTFSESKEKDFLTKSRQSGPYTRQANCVK